MIIKMQTLFMPYDKSTEEKKTVQLSIRDKVKADRIVILLLFLAVIVAAIIFS